MLTLKDLTHEHTLRPYERNGQLVVNTYLVAKYLQRSNISVRNLVLGALNYNDHATENTHGYDRKLAVEGRYVETFENKIWAEMNEAAFRWIFLDTFSGKTLNERIGQILVEFSKAKNETVESN